MEIAEWPKDAVVGYYCKLQKERCKLAVGGLRVEAIIFQIISST